VFWIIFFMLEREEGVFTPDHVGIRSNPKVCYLYPSYGLSFQTETPEEKSSGLKKAGVMGLEFWGSYVFAVYYSGLFETFTDWSYNLFLFSLPFITGSVVEVIGDRCGEKGNFWKGLIGGFMGSLIGGAVGKLQEPKPTYPTEYIFLVAIFPSLGSIIGYNLPEK